MLLLRKFNSIVCAGVFGYFYIEFTVEMGLLR